MRRGEELIDILPNVQVPLGLRTVSGEFNNLVTSQDQFGSADDLFPRLLSPEWRVVRGRLVQFRRNGCRQPAAYDLEPDR